MKEIITLLITSGGAGFLNLYIAQESDLLYFGKYNEKERVAWLAIFSSVNYLFVKVWIYLINSDTLINKIFVKIHPSAVEYNILIASILVLLSILISIVLPYFVVKLIQLIRRINKKPYFSYLPPLNTFLTDIENYELYIFDFEKKLINNGKIYQGTEERQLNLSLILLPSKKNEISENYDSFINWLADNKNTVSYLEYTDYDRKYHLIKVRER